MIDENLRRSNAKRVEYNYDVNDRVMMVEYDPTKLEARTRGPYRTARAFANGAVKLQLSAHEQETVNIRKIYPYRGP